MKREQMSQAQFVQHAETFFHDEVLGLLKKKGEHYSNGENAFNNFDAGSAQFDNVSPQQYLMVMATKHWQNLCENPHGDVTERVTDIIVYMLLLEAYNSRDWTTA